MTKLLLHRNTTVEETSAEVIEGVIRNRHSGYETLQMLENHFGQIDFSESDVKTAAESGRVTMLALILTRCSVTEATPPVLLAAAAKGSLEVMMYLLGLDKAVVTKETMVAASGNIDCNIEMLIVLWKLAPDIKVCPEMFLNAGDRIFSRSTDLEFLFSRVEDAEMCQNILNAVMRDRNTQNNWVHEPLLKTILKSDFAIEVTDGLAMGAFKASRGRLLKALLYHGMDIKLSQEMVETAVELKDYSGLGVLVKHGNPHELDLQVAKDMVDNAPPRWAFDED